MFLQHFNLGFPLVDSTTLLILPEHTSLARDDQARGGLEKCCEFCEPVSGYSEQVFYHDLAPEADGRVAVSLINPTFNGGQGLGVRLRYSKKQYPILVEWKMMQNGMYVVGLEPATCRVEGRCAERKSGRLQILQPQEIRQYAIEIELFNNANRGAG